MKKVILILAILLVGCSSDDDNTYNQVVECECWEITDVSPFYWDDGQEAVRVDFLKDCVEERFSIFPLNTNGVNQSIIGECYNEILM